MENDRPLAAAYKNNSLEEKQVLIAVFPDRIQFAKPPKQETTVGSYLFLIGMAGLFFRSDWAKDQLGSRANAAFGIVIAFWILILVVGFFEYRRRSTRAPEPTSYSTASRTQISRVADLSRNEFDRRIQISIGRPVFRGQYVAWHKNDEDGNVIEAIRTICADKYTKISRLKNSVVQIATAVALFGGLSILAIAAMGLLHSL